MLLWNGYFLLVNRGIPNIKTAPAIRKKIIEILKVEKDNKQKKDFIIYDLGAGNGTFTRHIAKEIPDATIIGIEISRLAYWRCLIGMKLSGLKNLRYSRADFYSADITDADAVVFFLLGSLMGEIRPKLEQDLAAGTLVCSNKFKIGGDWQPLEEIDVQTLAPHQKMLYVYRK